MENLTPVVSVVTPFLSSRSPSLSFKPMTLLCFVLKKKKTLKPYKRIYALFHPS